MPDGEDNKAFDVGEAVQCDDPADEIDLANIFRPSLNERGMSGMHSGIILQ